MNEYVTVASYSRNPLSECASIWQQNRYISNLKKYLNTDSLVNWAVLQTHLSPNVLALCSKVSVLCYDIYLSVFFITCLLEAHTHHLISYIHLMLITLTSKKQKNEVKLKEGLETLHLLIIACTGIVATIPLITALIKTEHYSKLWS